MRLCLCTKTTRCCKTLIIAIVHPQTLTIVSNHAAIVPKLRNLVLLNSKSEQNHLHAWHITCHIIKVIGCRPGDDTTAFVPKRSFKVKIICFLLVCPPEIVTFANKVPQILVCQKVSEAYFEILDLCKQTSATSH